MREGAPDERRKTPHARSLGDVVPDRKLRFPDPSERSRLSRREALKLIFKGAAGGALATDIVGALLKEPLLDAFNVEEKKEQDADLDYIDQEKQAAMDSLVARVQENLRKPEIMHALRGEGDEPVAVVLDAIEIPVLPEYLKDTSYDASRLQGEYPIQIINDHGISNGAFYNGELLTAAHCLFGSDETQYPTQGIDVAVRTPDIGLVSQNVDKKMLKDSVSLTNADIEGQFISVVGIDDDDTADSSGHKTYAGIAVRMTPGLARFMGEKYTKEMENSFMFILPAGEAKAVDERNLRASGMSGSPVFVHRGKKPEFAGVFWGVKTYEDHSTGRCYDIGFFHSIDEVRRAAGAQTHLAHAN